MTPAKLQNLVRDGSFFALAIAPVEGRPQTIFRYGPTALPEIYSKASRSSDAPFLVTQTGVFTRGDLLGRAGAYAQLFARGGIERNSRVALTLEEGIDWIATFLALTSLGATAVLTHGVHISQQIRSSGCTAAIGAQTGETGVKTIFDSRALRRAQSKPSPLVPREMEPDQEASIAFTSGSCGLPKGVILTHRGLTTGLMNMMLGGALVARSSSLAQPKTKPVVPTVLLRTPLAHVSGYMQMLLMLIIGGRLVTSTDIDILSLLHQHQVTSVTGVTDDDIQMLLAASEASVHPLRSIAVVGRMLPSAVRDVIRGTLPNLGIGAGYGLTETSGLVSAVGNDDLDTQRYSVGPVLPTVECRITHHDGTSCAIGESGQIWLRGAMMMRGYCNAADHSMPDGWFATGDIGYLADDGALNVLDRQDRLLRSGKERVSCREIEDVARELFDGMGIAAVSLPQHGEEDRLVIFAESRSKDLSGLKASLMQKFPGKLIDQAAFVALERLPRTASGKTAYATLLERAAP
jgi:long-chain acyl-CoA synthetase